MLPALTRSPCFPARNILSTLPYPRKPCFQTQEACPHELPPRILFGPTTTSLSRLGHVDIIPWSHQQRAGPEGAQ